MELQKKNFVDFYTEIRDQFPKMKELSTWDNYDWSLDGSENVLIMSEIAEEMVRWVADRQESEAQRLMDLVERYFREGDSSATSIMYTDFLVEIIGAKKEARETIKKMMGPRTDKLYKNLLNLYWELDT